MTHAEGQIRSSQDQLEAIIDGGSLAGLLENLETVCYAKAEHLRANWTGKLEGDAWEFVARRVAKAASAALGYGLALLLCIASPALAAPAPCVVNVSTCNVVTCAYLPGVGQVTGGLISNAHPKNEAELDAVKGIGPKKLEALRPFVVYGDAPTTCKAKQTAPKSTDGAK